MQLGVGMVVAMLVSEMSVWQHDDKAADVANDVIDPTRLEDSVVAAFMLEREVMHHHNPMQKHRRPDQPGV